MEGVCHGAYNSECGGQLAYITVFTFQPCLKDEVLPFPTRDYGYHNLRRISAITRQPGFHGNISRRMVIVCTVNI